MNLWKSAGRAERTSPAVSRCILAAGMAMSASCAFAGPPFQTDDPEPVDLHHYELYVASQQTLTADGRSGTMPHLEFNYGALPNTMLHIVVPYAFNRPAGGPTERGMGDTELGFKYRFLEETETTPSVGIFPLYEAPTGDSDRGLGNGAYQIYIPVWVQKSWGKWTTYGGGGYWINHATDGRNNWFAGWLLQRELTEHWTLGAEIYHRTEQFKGQGASTGFNVGGYYNIDDHNHVLFSAGRGLQNADATNKFSSYVAYQLTY